MNTAGKATLSFGVVSLPIKLGKADQDDGVDLSSRCECGESVKPMRNEDGDAVVCTECDRSYSWWNSVPAKAYEVGDDEILLEEDELDAATADDPVDHGDIEKVVPVDEVVRHYAVVGSYYVVPESEDFGEQYAALQQALDRSGEALLTYLPIGKTRRYAVVARQGVLLALKLADMRPLDEDVNFVAGDGMVDQISGLLDPARADDPALEDVADIGLKELIREKIPAPDADAVADEPAPDAATEADGETDAGADDEAETEEEEGQATLV